ncbi:RNA polymerase sigma factor [Thalassotalea marina]|uniref:DNA-directed RNA polymerase sigma-70 factor n=1 Tax=Thalassotalea marina TaxID=1673741 RepID=A0A919BFD0_9GAMM|nr:sigma-70 family RNA polymerase sigma factor [Thalassotalea marina]GHF87584.1 DNA-directed RNA polymerase sigma-70 factor [Thalassotalea marina]
MDSWEDKLIDNMRSGDKYAFEQCYRQLSPQIYTAIYKICQNSDTARELLHDTFIDVYESIHSYKKQGSFQGWVKRIAFNNTFNFLKRNKKFVFIEDANVEEQYIDFNHGDAVHDCRLLDSVLDKCTEVERLILWLFIVEQYSHEEIAVLASKSPSFSKSIVSRTLKRIRLFSEVKKHAY